MLGQLNMEGLTKTEVAIKRLQTFEPPEGYYLAFSGGKDSCVVKALADMAGVKYDAHYNHTSVDPPELIYFIRENHPDVIFDYPRYPDGTRITMWNLIPKKKMPPTRLVRYCCEYLKEGGGAGRVTVTGVRNSESVKRRSRSGLEIGKGNRRRERLDPDNPSDELMMRICPTKSKIILNPIIDWDESDVWEFILKNNIPYCCLYDQGHKRIGCIGCPMNNKQKKEKELEKYPGYKNAYLTAFRRMLENRDRDDRDNVKAWHTPEKVMEWWLKR